MGALVIDATMNDARKEALHKELADAHVEIANLKAQLETANKKISSKQDVFETLNEMRKALSVKMGWESAKDSGQHLAELLRQGLPDQKKGQALAVAAMFSLMPGSMLMFTTLVYIAIFRGTSRVVGAALVIYCVFIVFDGADERGGRMVQWFRDHSFWKHVTNYFPIELQKMNPETEFPADGVYLFGYHPHGVISLGCLLNFMTTATGFPALLPGLNIRGGTLAFNFRIPFFREVLLSLGAIAVSARSIKYWLNRGPGSAVIIVPGGAAEALDARPGTHELVLRRRNGFFRIALQHGVRLVPIYSFGENELYEQLPNRPGSLLRSFQEWGLRTLGYSVPYFLGVGSQPWPGSGSSAIPMNPVPRRHPVITVIGDPILCPRIENPTQDQIDALKEKYISKLQEIFDRFADKYAPVRESDLKIVK